MGSALCPTLVGRDAELQVLDDALQNATRGEGQVVILAAEAGMGKTRIALELARRAADRGVVVLSGSCSEAALALPYLPFLEAIGTYLLGAQIGQLGRRLGPFQRDLAQLFPQLTPDSQQPENPDPTERKLRLFEALLRLVRIIADERGLLLVTEDLHWSDASTRELLDYLAHRIGKTRVMLLATYRRDEMHRKHPLNPLLKAWHQAGVAKKVALEPLSAEQVAAMVCGSLELKAVGPQFRDLMHARSEGNPFVVEEMLRAALDQGVYRKVTGWDSKALADLKMPDTVRELVGRRLERLSQQHAEIMRAAAVLGSSFDYRTLVAVSGATEEAVQAALQASVEEQLVEEVQAAVDTFRFRHALTREAIYEDVIRPKRERLHARAAAVLRELPGTPTVDLAHHLLAANQLDEAVPVCLRAAEEAERRSGFREAAELYERAVPHITDKRMRGEVLCRLGRIHHFSGDAADESYLGEGIDLMEACGQFREAAAYHGWLGRSLWMRSRHDLAFREYELARTNLEPYGPSEELAYIYLRLADMHCFQTRSAQALVLAELALSTAEAAGADAARIWAYGSLGLAYYTSGQVSKGIEYVDRSYREAAERGLTWITATSLQNSIELRIFAFRAAEAAEAVNLLRRQPGALSETGAEFIEGMRRFRLGEPKKAAVHLDKALSLIGDGSGHEFIWIQLHRALVFGSLGRFEEARRILPARDVEREKQDAVLLAYAAGRINLDAGDLPAAVREVNIYIAMMEWTRTHLPDEMLVLDVAVESLLRSGMITEAERLIAQTRPPDSEDPMLRRMQGRLALAQGDLNAASKAFTDVAHFFETVEYREEESRTRRALAQTKALAGDHAGAEAELRRVLAYADAFGASFEGMSARRQISEFGIRGIPRGPRPSTRSHPARLTNRELEVLNLMANGSGNQEIAKRLFLSPKTIDHHVSSILGKLGVHSRMEAVRAAEKLGPVGEIRESPTPN